MAPSTKQIKKVKTLATSMKHVSSTRDTRLDAHQSVDSRRALRNREVANSDSDDEHQDSTRPILRSSAAVNKSQQGSSFRKTPSQEEKEKKEQRERERTERQKAISAEIDEKNSKIEVRDPDAIPFCEDTERMKKRVKRSVKMITYKRLEKYLAAEQKRMNGIQNDAQLKNLYKREIPRVPDARNISVDARTIYNNLQRRKNEMSAEQRRQSEEAAKEEKGKGQKPREEKLEEKRALLMTNFSGLNACRIPVYCHRTKHPTDCNVPSTLFLRYTNENVHRDQELEQLEKCFEKGANMIRCDCHSRTPIVNCWENKECPCYQMNAKLKRLQTDALQNGTENSFYPPTDFNTFKAIKLNVGSDDQTIGFACHDECGCKGSCSNNVLMLMEKMSSLNSLILERKDEKLGFQVTTENAIPSGTPIAHFSGEMTTFWNRDPDNNDYIYKTYDPKYGNLGDKVSKLMENWPKNLKTQMGKTYQKNWYIDPKVFGNIARMFNHNCEPNSALVRVFQKGFSPSQMKLVVVTLRDIFSGEELTIDYGVDYGRVLDCRCGTLSCHSTPFRDLTEDQIKSILKKERSKKAEVHHRTIVSQLE